MQRPHDSADTPLMSFILLFQRIDNMQSPFKYDVAVKRPLLVVSYQIPALRKHLKKVREANGQRISFIHHAGSEKCFNSE